MTVPQADPTPVDTEQTEPPRAAGPHRVAVVGLGNMGGPMAANLVRAGYDVAGFDLSAQANTAAEQAGVRIAADAAAAASGADVVITMLPAGRHVRQAYTAGPEGTAGLLAAAPPGALFIDCSTIDVADARAAAGAAHQAGHRALDAPVSGGTTGATNGTLTFMVGGSDTDVASAGPVLAAMGRKTVHCGSSGAGQAAKLCNNMLLGIQMIGVSEAFVLAESLGLSAESLFEVSSTATGQCWALNTNCPVPGPVPTSPANRDYQGGFAVALMAKDLGLATSALDAGGLESPLGRLAARVYTDLAEGERAGQDFSTVINTLREHTARPATEAPA